VEPEISATLITLSSSQLQGLLSKCSEFAAERGSASRSAHNVGKTLRFLQVLIHRQTLLRVTDPRSGIWATSPTDLTEGNEANEEWQGKLPLCPDSRPRPTFVLFVLVHYLEPAHFCREFRRFHGVSPAEMPRRSKCPF